MEPIAVCVRADGEWALVHRCGGCAIVHVNRIAGDDSPLMLMQLAVRPPRPAAVPARVATLIGLMGMMACAVTLLDGFRVLCRAHDRRNGSPRSA
jgi:RNHCP domain